MPPKKLKAWFEKDHIGRLRGSSDRIAAWIDAPTPNKLTLIGLVFAPAAMTAFLCGELALGATLFVISCSTDIFDGMLARFQDAQFRKEAFMQHPSDEVRQAVSYARRLDFERTKPFFRRRGISEGGTAFDPFVDKIRYFAVLLPLGAGRLNGWLIAVGALFAVSLTAMRFFVKASPANILGKSKVYFEFALILWMIVIPASSASPLVGNLLLAMADLGGLASLAGQAYTLLRDRAKTKTAPP